MSPIFLIILERAIFTFGSDVLSLAIDAWIKPKVGLGGADYKIVNREIKKLFAFNEWNGIAVLRATGLKLSTVHMDNTKKIHDKNNCSLVKRRITPVDFDIVYTDTQPEYRLVNYFENNSNFTVEYKVQSAVHVVSKVSTSWSKTVDTTYSRGISLGIRIPYVYFEWGRPRIGLKYIKSEVKHQSTYGVGETKSEDQEIETDLGLKVRLEPTQSAVAEMINQNGKLKIQVDYESTLVGDLVVTFTNKTVVCWPVGDVMAMGNYTNFIKSHEIVDLGYFVTGKVVLYDLDTYIKNLETPIYGQDEQEE